MQHSPHSSRRGADTRVCRADTRVGAWSFLRMIQKHAGLALLNKLDRAFTP
jgi:hypothetical protein